MIKKLSYIRLPVSISLIIGIVKNPALRSFKMNHILHMHAKLTHRHSSTIVYKTATYRNVRGHRGGGGGGWGEH